MTKTVFLLSLSLCLFLVNCSEKDSNRWPVKIIGEVYHCVFLPENIIIVTTDMGVFCYDLSSGNQKWKNYEIVTLYKPIFIKESLITGVFCESGLYSININNGKVKKLFDTEEWVHAVQIQDENNILAVTQDVTTRKYTLQRYSMINGSIEKIITLDAAPKCKLEYFNGNIILSTAFGKIDNLFVIDGTTNMVKWKDSLGDIMTLLDNSDFVRVENNLYYIKYDGTRNYLLQVDINSGNIIDCISIPFLISGNYIRLNKKDILICGRFFYYIFDTTTKQFSKATVNYGDLGYTSFVNDDNIVFNNDGGIYCYSIHDKIQEKLYDLEGKELFRMFGNTTSVILIAADNAIESLANNLHFDLIVIKYRS